MGFHIVEQSCANPIANIWSIKISDSDCPLLSTTGTGTSKNAALASALNNFIKHLATHYFWSDYYLGDEVNNSQFVHFSNEKWFETNSSNSWPDKVLNDELREFYNPIGELNANSLIDITSSNPNRGVCCIPYKSLYNNKDVYFPVNLVDNLYANNGIATGSSIEEARNNSLCKIIENYIQYKVMAEGISLPNIPESHVNQYPQLNEIINNIEQAGYSILIKDASFNGVYPVVLVLLLDTYNQGICASFSANTDFERALEDAITKLFKDKTLDKMESFAEAGFDMDEISSSKNLEYQFTESRGITAWESLADKSNYTFFDWGKKYPKKNDTETFKQLSKIISLENNQIFVTEYQTLDIYACRMLIPGLSEIYPLDDLVWENNNAGIKVREQILKKNKSIRECEQLIEDLEDLDLDDNYLISKLIGMPSDEKTIFHDLCVAELILLLALKTQDNERMQEGCEWILHYKQINNRRLKTYKCINTLLQLNKMTDYATVLEKLYTHETLNDALALINGEDIFPLESEWKEHSSLIEAYKKLIEY